MWSTGIFERLAVVFREGIISFEQYFNRGLAIDGTHMKTATGGVLLVACFRHCNAEIQIVAVAVV